MALPSLHKCLRLSDENEQLVKKLKKLHMRNKDLEKNLGQIQEKLHLQQLMHDCVTSRDVQVQTETHLWHKGGYSKDLNLESDNVRLLQMYNELQKRYVKEIKTNQEQSEAIKNLTDFFEEVEDLKHAVQESVKLNNDAVFVGRGDCLGLPSLLPDSGGFRTDTKPSMVL
ncbi:hypothetical protein AV530_006160 [Patagioenas fasciata monilis]|uniref:Uncharacterized protein n=1 Tax=Patagioenas fasciata monilis TaxID=372326 RepID=A0A1V4J8X2_PATFA|nr:hypothetical protein AV530_006160 [Patagioenas fasciata monilis]